MDILAKARDLEAKLARTVDRAAARVMPATTGPREPLEIAHAVVDLVEKEVQPAGRGRHLFPFNRIKVLLVAPSRHAQARFDATFAEEPTLTQRIQMRLESAGCVPAGLAVSVEYVPVAGQGWTASDVHVEFDRVDVPTSAEATVGKPASEVEAEPEPAVAIVEEPPPAVEIEIATGSAEQPKYEFQFPRIDLGRCTHVRDRRNQLVRTNHVAFADTDDAVNRTVSRRHAHLEYVAAERAFRVYDDGSEQGTAVARGGRTIAVPPGARGVRLQPGDEILLGNARLRVTVVGAAFRRPM
ncbi:MAG TPA: FHA domain-containing protein [Vicinamibacterales bacterium]|nr:FHA domain-containing protein [Vicinamibacterales bacterium]